MLAAAWLVSNKCLKESESMPERSRNFTQKLNIEKLVLDTIAARHYCLV